MKHLALAVTDQERSRRFYESYFGFDALGDGVPIVEEWDEPEYVSVNCRDPDGCVVEAAWEPGR